VVKGILLVAIIQAALAFIGFKAIGLPAAGIFTLLVLVTAIVQIPAILTMIPAILIAFSNSEPTYAIIFAIWCILVGFSDNILKPMLLGKGLKTPMIVILIGTIGGLLLHGIIGLFVGAVVLAIVYQLYVYWVNGDEVLPVK
jgi:predicted PurR-regulated permease PerM